MTQILPSFRAGEFSFALTEQVEHVRPLSRTNSVAIREELTGTTFSSLTVICSTNTAFTDLKTARDAQVPIHIRTDMDEHWWVVITSDFKVELVQTRDRINTPLRYVTFSAVEVLPTQALSMPTSASPDVYASVPDSTALDITGDIDVRVESALTYWRTGGAIPSPLISKWNPTGDQRSWKLVVNTDGTMTWSWSTLGTAASILTATTTLAIPNSTRTWVRVTHDVDNGSSQNVVKFYLSNNGVTWRLHDTVTASGTTSIFSSSSPVLIGLDDTTTGNEAIGKHYRAQVYSGIAGTLVLDVAFSDVDVLTSTTPTSFPARTGQTVTINGSSWAWSV